MMARLAECAPPDVESLLAMMVDFNAFEGIAWTPDAGRPALERLLADPGLGVAARVIEGDATRGYCVVAWGYDLEWGGRDAFLTELYLRPEARGRGLGGRVLPLVEALAVRHGARALHLMVQNENERAARLYRSAGYVTPPRTFMTKVLVK